MTIARRKTKYRVSRKLAFGRGEALIGAVSSTPEEEEEEGTDLEARGCWDIQIKKGRTEGGWNIIETMIK